MMIAILLAAKLCLAILKWECTVFRADGVSVGSFRHTPLRRRQRSLPQRCEASFVTSENEGGLLLIACRVGGLFQRVSLRVAFLADAVGLGVHVLLLLFRGVGGAFTCFLVSASGLVFQGGPVFQGVLASLLLLGIASAQGESGGCSGDKRKDSFIVLSANRVWTGSWP